MDATGLATKETKMKDEDQVMKVADVMELAASPDLDTQVVEEGR